MRSDGMTSMSVGEITRRCLDDVAPLGDGRRRRGSRVVRFALRVRDGYVRGEVLDRSRSAILRHAAARLASIFERAALSRFLRQMYSLGGNSGRYIRLSSIKMMQPGLAGEIILDGE